MNWLTGIFSAIGSVFGYLKDQLALHNSPPMQQADQKNKEQKEEDRDAEAIKNQNGDRVRNGLG